MCDLPCSSSRGVKIHKAQKHKPAPTQKFAGSLADKVVKCNKIKQQQSSRPHVSCNGIILENVYCFKYLGTLFTADADQMKDIKARIAQAMTRCGSLRHIFSSPNLSLHLKIRLYEAAVVSLLSYGSETWDLNAQTCRTLRGANSRMLAWFTGKSIPEEARQQTTSFNIIQKLRTRRLRWVGHILRSGEGNPAYQALVAQHEMNNTGNLLMDAPFYHSFGHLSILAQDRAYWRDLVSSIPAFD